METVNRANRATASIMRVMGVFGGVQVVTILCSIVRTKLVALWIGAAGVGIFALLNSALDMVGALTTLGIGSSSVRDIAASREPQKSLTATVVVRWGRLLGLFGAVVMLALSPLLSRYTFGSLDSWWQFAALGICLLLNSMWGTRQAVMQGYRDFRRLARASVWSAVGGVAVSAPLFYFLGINSIVPAMIGFSVVMYLSVRFRYATIPVHRNVGREVMWTKARDFLRLGAYMTATGFFAYLVNYIFMSWLNGRAGEAFVGYYQGGYTLFNKYAGLIFTAITVEYYPRLASVAAKRRAMSTFVNHEATLLLWMLLVILPVFIVAVPLIIRVLYAPDFLVMTPLVTVGVCGTVLRGLSWCMSYTILARGDGRLFLISEVISSAVCLCLNMGGYLLGGLEGLGVSYIVWYAVYTLIVLWIYRCRYRLTLAVPVVHHAVLVFAASCLCAAIALLWPGMWWANLAISAVFAWIGFVNLRRLYRR